MAVICHVNILFQYLCKKNAESLNVLIINRKFASQGNFAFHFFLLKCKTTFWQCLYWHSKGRYQSIENYDEDIIIDSKEYEAQLKFGTNKIAFVYTTQQLEQVLDNIEDYEIIGLGENIILNNSEKELLEQKNIQIIEL